MADPRAYNLVDRTSDGLVALVFVATTAMGLQAIWWSWHVPLPLEERGAWNLLHQVISVAGQKSLVRWLLIGGAVPVALAMLGIVLRRAWGFVLALPCSAALIASAVLARYFAVFDEPRQYVARSPYVQAAMEIALITVAGHGAAMILGVRRLCRTPARPALVRVVLCASAALLAAAPAFWLAEHLPGGARNAAIMCASAAAVLAAWITCAVARRGVALASIGVSVTSLVVFAIAIALCLQDRPRRGGLYSRTAEHLISEVVVMTPFVLVLIGLCLVLRRHLATPHGDAAARAPTG